MPDKKVIKVKVKKKKINFRKTILALLIVYFIYFLIFNILNANIKNIYVKNNNYVKDVEIIELANLEDYPSFYLTRSSQIRKKILNNPYIKDVKVNKKLFGQLDLVVTEKRPLFINYLNKKLVVDTKEELDNIYDINYLPYLMNEVDSEVYDYFVEQFNLVNDDVLLKISEIHHKPLIVDKGRCLLYMNDGNLVYITLSKIELLNNYNEIVSEFANKKGILYLDSGNYFDEEEERGEV